MAEPDLINYSTELLPLLRRANDYREGLIYILRVQPANFYAVANFNLKVEPHWCRNKFQLFDLALSRALLGRRWSRRIAADRPFWIAVPERATFLHFNMLWQVPSQYCDQFVLEGPVIWRKIVPSGELYVRSLGSTPEDRVRVAAYCTKAFHPRWTLDNLVTSSEVRRK